jgi:hypothetical protein
MTEMSPLRRRMIEDMTVRNLSPATQRSYVHAVAKFGRLPDKLDLEDVRAFQVHLVAGGITAAHNCAVRGTSEYRRAAIRCPARDSGPPAISRNRNTASSDAVGSLSRGFVCSDITCEQREGDAMTSVCAAHCTRERSHGVVWLVPLISLLTRSFSMVHMPMTRVWSAADAASRNRSATAR